jgi:hypothetical protein
LNGLKKKPQKTVNIIKALTSTKWGKQKETLVNTYKTITRPIIEYGSTIWAPIISDTNVNKLQVIQNSALRIATGCTSDTNTQHLHEETKVLPLREHLKLHSSQLRLKTQISTHPLNKLNNKNPKSRHIRETIFDNKDFTINPKLNHNTITNTTIEKKKTFIHSKIVKIYTNQKARNKVIDSIAPEIDKHEETLPRDTRRTLSQLRTNKSPVLFSYKHKIDPTNYPSPLCPLCKTENHDPAVCPGSLCPHCKLQNHDTNLLLLRRLYTYIRSLGTCRYHPIIVLDHSLPPSK